MAFIYDRDPLQSEWLYQHELGRNHLKEVFGDSINTLKITAKTEEETIEAIQELVENEKVEVVFTTTANMVDASLKCAIKYPDVKILNCSLNTSHRYIRTYAARLYEAKFLSGMVAGALTKTNKVGYLADYPIYGVTANINAFALGAKMVNPYAKVYLKWSTLKNTWGGAGNAEAVLDEVADWLCAEHDTESEADARMLADAINRFLDRLPETDRQVFVRRYWYFQSVAEIAEALSCSESKVKSMLYRTRQKLHTALEKEALL